MELLNGFKNLKDVVNQRVRCATLALGTVQAAIEERKRQDARDVVAARTASTES